MFPSQRKGVQENVWESHAVGFLKQVQHSKKNETKSMLDLSAAPLTPATGISVHSSTTGKTAKPRKASLGRTLSASPPRDNSKFLFSHFKGYDRW
jgi:hypothetical protein